MKYIHTRAGCFDSFFMATISAVSTVLIMGWTLKYCAHGFNITDEGYHLNWISNPFIYSFSISQFGYMYHPLYILVDENVAALRRLNVIITFTCALALVYAFLISYETKSRQKPIELSIIAMGLSTSALILFDNWLVTPHYNSLVFQALLITGCGVILIEGKSLTARIAGCFLVGVGGAFTFLAKPSSALVLALAVLITLLCSSRFPVKYATISSTIAALLVIITAVAVDGSVTTFVYRLQLGAQMAELLNSGHSISESLRIDTFYLTADAQLALVVFFALSFIGITAALTNSFAGRVAAVFSSCVSFLIIIVAVFNLSYFGARLGHFKAIIPLGIALSFTLVGVLVTYNFGLRSISRQQWSTAALFVIMPYIYAFGTNNNYWQHGSSAIIFWLLSALTLLGPLSQKFRTLYFLLPAIIAVQAITATLLHTGLEKPHVQPNPLRLSTNVYEVGGANSPLKISSEYVKYFNEVKTAAWAAGFDSDTPVIDLTGQSPGLLYVLRAESIGNAWLIGKHPGSFDAAVAALQMVDCTKIANAWVLHEPESRRTISPAILRTFGITFPDDYDEIGHWLTADGPGRYAARSQSLYKPLWPQSALQSCRDSLTQESKYE